MEDLSCEVVCFIEEWDGEEEIKKKDVKSTGNLKGGELEGIIPKHDVRVQPILWEYQEVFGELLDHRVVKKLVTMDLEMRPEWEGVPLKCRPYPLSKEDQEQQDQQIEELLAKGLIEEYLGSEFPKYCSPTFMVPKKGTNVKRLTVDYKRLNQRTETTWAPYPTRR